MRRLLFALLLAVQLPAAAFAAVPARVEITYAVFLGSMRIGEGRDVFRHDGRTYRVVSESKTAGLAAALYRLNIRRESQGRVTRAGLRPEAFTEERNGKPKRSAAFDWERKQATLVDGDNSQTVPLPDNSWDSTSFGYNFAFVPPEAAELAAHLTDGRRLKQYRYAVLGREKLDTELGTLETLHVRRLQLPEDKRAFEVWLAVDRHNMPVRIRYTEKDGTVFDSIATKVTFADK
jgi:hypothetical protein